MKLFLAGLVLLAVANGARAACTCEDPPNLCNADFIVRVALGNYNDGHYWAVITNPNNVYKNANGDLVPKGQIQLFITADAGCVDQTLTPGQYVVGGSVVNGRIELNSCSSYVQPWAQSMESSLSAC